MYICNMYMYISLDCGWYVGIDMCQWYSVAGEPADNESDGGWVALLMLAVNAMHKRRQMKAWYVGILVFILIDIVQYR